MRDIDTNKQCRLFMVRELLPAKKRYEFFTETTYALLKITLQICISKVYFEDIMPLCIHILYTSARLLASTNKSSIFNLHKFYERPGNKISEEKK